MRKPGLVEDEAIIGELQGHRGVRLRCLVMKSEIPRISSRWKMGSDSVSSPGLSEATATISGTPVSGCREALPSLRSSIFGNGSRLKPSTKIKSQVPASDRTSLKDISGLSPRSCISAQSLGDDKKPLRAPASLSRYES